MRSDFNGIQLVHKKDQSVSNDSTQLHTNYSWMSKTSRSSETSRRLLTQRVHSHRQAPQSRFNSWKINLRHWWMCHIPTWTISDDIYPQSLAEKDPKVLGRISLPQSERKQVQKKALASCEQTSRSLLQPLSTIKALSLRRSPRRAIHARMEAMSIALRTKHGLWRNEELPSHASSAAQHFNSIARAADRDGGGSNLSLDFCSGSAHLRIVP
jgi:hypothetical protein